MQHILEMLFGTKDHIDLAQECARAVLIFLYGLALLRVSGRRTFAKASALDVVLSIMVGSALSRAMTASAPLPGTLAAAAVLVALHVAFGQAVARSAFFSRLVEGRAVVLARDGVMDEGMRLWQMLSKADLDEALRRKQVDGIGKLRETRLVVVEPNGAINVLKR